MHTLDARRLNIWDICVILGEAWGLTPHVIGYPQLEARSTSVLGVFYDRHLGCRILSLGVWDTNVHCLTLVIQDDIANREWVLNAKII